MDPVLIRPYSVLQWRCQWSAFRGWPSHSMCSRPHLAGKPDWPRADFAKNCLLWAGSKVTYRDFAKNHALGRHVRKISEMSGQKNGVQHATAIYPIPRYTRPWYIGRTLYITTFFKIIWNRKGLGLENLGKLRSGCAVVLKTTSLQVYNQPCSWCSVLEQSWLVTNHSRLFREASPDFKFNP